MRQLVTIIAEVNALFSDTGSLSFNPSFNERLILRAKSLAKACYLRLHYNENTSDLAKNLEAITQHLNKLKTDLTPPLPLLLNEKQMLAIFKGFFWSITQIVNPEKPRKAAKEIQVAESYTVLMDDEFYQDKTIQISADTTYRITRKKADLVELKELYTSIRDNNANTNQKPLWFRKIRSWEQALLTDAVKESLIYLYTTKTPTGSSKPALSNAGRDILSIINQRSMFYYHSTPSRHSQEEATAALRDYFTLYKNQMIEDFESRYGEQHGVTTIPILMGSLLTPASYEAMMPHFSENNSLMLLYKKEAIRLLQEHLNHRKRAYDTHPSRNVYYHFSIIDTNHPINGRRTHTAETAISPKRLRNGHHIVRTSIHTILTYATDLSDELRTKLTEVQEYLSSSRKLRNSTAVSTRLEITENSRWSLFLDTLKAYVDAWRQGEALQDHQNHSLYLASCESILIQECGGAVQSNCKSSKDRLGLLKAYNTYLRISYQKNGRIPRYGSVETVSNRQELTDCVTKIPSEIASQLAPGSYGIKNEGSTILFRILFAIRDILPFFWKDNYFKYMPEFFRRAADNERGIGDRFNYAVAAIACIIFPIFAAPIIRLISYQAMTPTSVARSPEFLSQKKLAGTNKTKPKSLRPDPLFLSEESKATPNI
jgi:hypothetical protein